MRLELRLTIALVLAAASASAQTLELLGPEHAVPPEGFLVAVQARNANGEPVPPQKVELKVEGGIIRPAPPRPPLHTLLVVPDQGAKAVVVRASQGALRAQQRYVLGPPAAKVVLTLAGERLPVKGEDADATLDVRVLDADGAPDEAATPPVLRANVGVVEALSRVGPGHFRGRYVLPDTRYPEVAVIVAFAPWPHPDSIHGAAGSLLVPLASAIDLPGTSERNAELTLEIAGRTFGPTKAGPDGRFKIPVVVPPGHQIAQVIAKDRAGNRRRSRFHLRVPPTDQLACVVNPRRLPADGAARARVVCATSDVFGAPKPGAKVALRTSAGGQSERRALGDGASEWIVTAPSSLGPPLRLQATWRDGRNVSRDELEVELVQGPAARLEVASDEPLVHRGAQLEATVQVKDPLGRPRDGATVVAHASEGEVQTAPKNQDAPGTFFVSFRPAPEGEAATARLTLRAFGPTGTQPARLQAWVEGGRLWVGVTDLLGRPVPDQPVRVGDREVKTGADGAADAGEAAGLRGAVQIRHARWPGLATTLHLMEDGHAWPRSERPGSAPFSLEVTVAPPVPVNVRFDISGRQVTYWLEDGEGRLLADREAAHAVQGAKVTSLRRDGARTILQLSSGRAQVGVRDVATGVVGWATVEAGP